MMELRGGAMSEIRYATRSLLKSPMFTLIAIVTLGLGLGANTAIFSVVDAVMLRPLPYPHSDRIVSFSWLLKSGGEPANITPLTFQYWHDRARSFDGFAVTSGGNFNMTSG